MVVETDDIHPSIPSMQKAAKEFKAEKERRGRKAGAPPTHASIHPCIYPFCGGRAGPAEEGRQARKWCCGRRSFLNINFVSGWLMGSPGQN